MNWEEKSRKATMELQSSDEISSNWPAIRQRIVGNLIGRGADSTVAGRIDDDLLSEASAWFVELYVAKNYSARGAVWQACRNALNGTPYVRKTDPVVYPQESYAVNEKGIRYRNTGIVYCHCGSCASCNRMGAVEVDIVESC